MRLAGGLTGLLIASIFAAGMSTIATSVTSSSTIILTDYYQRFRKHAGNRERMLVLKLSSVGVGVAGILVAFAFMSVQSALDAVVGVGVYFRAEACWDCFYWGIFRGRHVILMRYWESFVE